MNSTQYHIIKTQLESLIKYLEPYLPLANCHTVDYFTENLLSKNISESIVTEIKSLGYTKTLNCILNSKSCPGASNLNQYIADCASKSLSNNTEICLSENNLYEKINSTFPNTASVKLKAFVSEKKSHEIEVLSSLVNHLKQLSKVSHLIDVGDGKGYLSSMLALHYQIPVLGIDASHINTTSAINRAEKLGKNWNGVIKNPNKTVSKSSKFNPNSFLYKQVTQFVTETTDCKKLVSDVFGEEVDSLGLVGLHTCGNLAPSSLKIYTSNENIKVLCNVSCCYHLLTESYESEDGSVGFPLSNFLLSKNYKLGRNARMLTAQSIERILSKKEMAPITVFYRAIFQQVLNSYSVELPNKNVRRMKKECADFVEYAKRAMEKVEADVKISDKELDDIYELYRHRYDEMSTFYYLRCMLAPVIESLILLDRLLYLFEQGFEKSYLVKLFDPVVSPRCFGIVSLK